MRGLTGTMTGRGSVLRSTVVITKVKTALSLLRGPIVGTISNIARSVIARKVRMREKLWPASAGRACIKFLRLRGYLVAGAVIFVVVASVLRSGAEPAVDSLYSSKVVRKPGPAPQSCVFTGNTLQQADVRQSNDEKSKLPVDFDWEAYLFWRPDLKKRGLSTKEAVQQHYFQAGRKKKLLYKRYCMIMLYDVTGGEGRSAVNTTTMPYI